MSLSIAFIKMQTYVKHEVHKFPILAAHQAFINRTINGLLNSKKKKKKKKKLKIKELKVNNDPF